MNTVTPAIVGYDFNVGNDIPAASGPVPCKGSVVVSFTDYAASSDATSEASITVNVYSPFSRWKPDVSIIGWGSDVPLIGSLPTVGFKYSSPGSTESYTIFTTLPNPMAFTVTELQSDGIENPLRFDFTYGTQTFTVDCTNGNQTVGYFDIASPPPGTWWNVEISG